MPQKLAACLQATTAGTPDLIRVETKAARRRQPSASRLTSADIYSFLLKVLKVGGERAGPKAKTPVSN
jgi:hypothetical protein